MSYRKIDVVNVHEVHMQGPALHIPHTPHLAQKKHPARPQRLARAFNGEGSPAVDPRAKRKTRLLTVNTEEGSYDDMSAPLISDKNGKNVAINSSSDESSCCCLIS